MKFKLPEITYPPTPHGRRALHTNVYGNLKGYVGGKLFWEFGRSDSVTEEQAAKWLAGAELEDALA